MKWIAPLVALRLVLAWGLAKADSNTDGNLAAKGSITGTVTDSTGKAVVGAIVICKPTVAPKVESPKNEAPTTTTTQPTTALTTSPQGEAPHGELPKDTVQTDENGKYTFADLIAGDYVVKAADLATKTGGEAKVTVKAGEAATANVVIKAVNPKFKVHIRSH